MRKLKQKYVNNAGFALVGVLLVIVLVAGIGMTLIPLASNSMKMSSIDQQEKSAFYIAEAGMTVKMAEIEEQINDIYDNTSSEKDFYKKLANEIIISNDRYADFEKINENYPFALIDVKRILDKKNEFEIISTGHLENQSRTVSKIFSVEWEDKFKKITNPYELPELAIFVKKNVTLENNAEVIGNVGTLIPVHQSIKLRNNARITGDKLEKEKGLFPKLPVFPTIPQDLPVESNITLNNNSKKEYEINVSQRISEIDLSNNSTLTFDVGSIDKEIVVDQISIGNNGKIHLKGEGKLTIYVNDGMNFGNNTFLNVDGETNNLNVFYRGTNNVKFANNEIINGSLYANSADIELYNNNSIYGNIFTGGDNLTFGNNTIDKSQLILAPNAEVILNNNAEIKGRVFSKSTKLEPNSKIIYDTPFVLDGPISFDALDDSTGEDSFVETGASPIIESEPVRETDNH